MRIEDGAGSGTKAKVNNDQRLEVEAVTESRQEFHNQKGKGFLIGTDLISLTSTSESLIFYLENTGDKDIIVDNMWISTSTSNGSGRIRASLFSNVTGGTVISSATAPLAVQNLNFGSSTTLEANVYAGAEGRTQTGGTRFVYFTMVDGFGGKYYILDLDRNTFVLPKGTSIALSMTPPVGNTSFNVTVGMICYENNIED